MTSLVKIKCFSTQDSIHEIRLLLNKSYKVLADMGLNYVAATQDDEETLKRIATAERCYLGLDQDKIIATLSLYAPKPSKHCQWYNQSNVAKIGQFAVLPAYQGTGIGSELLNHAEEQARLLAGVTELALDTAETAYHLIAYYEKRGYRYIETIQWQHANYPSVIMSKSLL